MPHISKDGPIVARNEDGHLHSFVFVDHSDRKIPDLLEELAELRRAEFPRVWWAGSVVGDYLALIHAEVEDQNDLDGMQDFLEHTLWDAGVHCMKATEVAVINKVGTKHETPDILGLIGIKTVQGQTKAVAQRLAEIDADHEFAWFHGGSVLTGDLDILLQVNGDSLTEVYERLFPLDSDAPGILDGIEGIASTSTAVTDGRRGPFAEPLSASLFKHKTTDPKSKSGGPKAKTKSKSKSKPRSK